MPQFGQKLDLAFVVVVAVGDVCVGGGEALYVGGGVGYVPDVPLGVSLSVRKPIPAIMKPIQTKITPIPIIESNAPIQISVPAVWNKGSPERSDNMYSARLKVFPAIKTKIPPTINSGIPIIAKRILIVRIIPTKNKGKPNMQQIVAVTKPS